MKMGILKQFGLVIAIGMMIVFALGQTANAVSTVTVGSVEAAADQVDVVVPVFLKNEVALRGVVMPLLIRKIGPAYVDKVGLDIGDRMVGSLSEIVSYKWFNTGTSSEAICKRYDNQAPGTPGGFPGTASVTITDDTSPREKQTVTESPYGVFWTRNKLFQASLASGADVTGSFLITVDIGSAEGCFEIDSTCMDPANHVLLANEQSLREPADFAPGVVHVGACDGIVLGAPASVPETVRGPQAATLTWGEISDVLVYEVQIDETDNTFSNLTTDVFVQGTSYTYTVTDEQTIFWRVRAVPKDCAYCFGPWAGPQAYTDVQTIASSDIPDSYTLNQNYPNPFNASTVIEFTNKRDGNVKLEVYNILGQNVATLVDGFKPVGKYAITWDGTDSRGDVVPSGMYFYRVSTEDFSAVKKMTLLK